MVLPGLVPSAMWLANGTESEVKYFVAVQFEDFNKVTRLIFQKSSNINAKLGVSVISFTEFISAHVIIDFLDAFWPNIHGDATECIETEHLAASQQSVMAHDDMASILQQSMRRTNVIASP